MNHLKVIVILLALLMLLPLSAFSVKIPPVKYISCVENLDMYGKPDIRSKVIYTVTSNFTKVQGAGEQSDRKFKKNVAGLEMEEPLVKIREEVWDNDKKKVVFGWVFKGELKECDPLDDYCMTYRLAGGKNKRESFIEDEDVKNKGKLMFDKVVMSPNVIYDIDLKKKLKKNVAFYEQGKEQFVKKEVLYQTKKPLPDDAVYCLLVGDKYLKSHKFLDFTEGDKSALSEENRKLIEGEKKREIDRSWQMARAASCTVYAIVFKDTDKSRLQSIALIEGGSVFYYDLDQPLPIEEDFQIDDSGMTFPDRIHVYYIIQAHDGHELALTLLGLENNPLIWFKNKGNAFIELGSSDSYYSNIVDN